MTLAWAVGVQYTGREEDRQTFLLIDTINTIKIQRPTTPN